MAQRGNAFALAVCQALGVDPRKVRRAEIIADAKDVLRVRLVMVPDIATDALRAICDGLVADEKVVSVEVWRSAPEPAISITREFPADEV